MTATVRLNDALESTLCRLSVTLHKKKSDVIREAIKHYAKSIDSSKKSRILSAVEKTKSIDNVEFEDFNSAVNDGI